MIPNALYTPSIYINQKHYNLLINIWRNNDSPFLHVLEVVETLLVLLHLEIVLYDDREDVPAAYGLLDVGLKLGAIRYLLEQFQVLADHLVGVGLCHVALTDKALD